MMADILYDRIGGGYSLVRRPDARIARVIHDALGDAASVLNVGAGAGAYEPSDRKVVAVEPSKRMIAQRSSSAAPAVRGFAEQLPFPDDSFDAAMAIISDHHWRDRDRGLRELRRVARRRLVLFNADPAWAERFWLTAEYLPESLTLVDPEHRAHGAWARRLRRVVGDLTLVPVPIPCDCTDGFYGAYWRRPHAYLDDGVRSGISVFSLVAAEAVERAVAGLRADLTSGEWDRRHGELRELSELHLGYYVVRCELERG